MISLDNNKMNYRDPLDYNSVAYGLSLTGLAWVSAAAYGRCEAVSWKTGGCSFWKLSKMI
jgi:hypothetical protein